MAVPGADRPVEGGQVSGTQHDGSGAGDESEAEGEPSFFADPRRLVQTGLIVVVLIGAIYFLLPNIVGLDDALSQLQRADWVWITVALAFNVLAFASYVALFRGVVGESTLHLEWSESYQITMAGLAATRLFSAGGAGGIALTYWALRKAGMPRRQSACRMVAFLVLLYAVYLLALIIDGVLLETGVLHGPDPAGLTIIPAAIAGVVILVLLAIALLPEDFERRISAERGGHAGALLRRVTTVPATLASGIRTAIDFVRNPSRGGLAIAGAVGFWTANIGILWAAFHAFDVQVPLGVVIQGFFIGMVANLIPFVPGGVGAVDAGMIGTFVLFGLPASEVFAAVLVYRLIAFWLPIPPGIVAFFQLRRTVARWEQERGRATSNALQNEVTYA
ncbi:MAG: lysylphosphatidylglycerol synthase transmembrane domain-containing protein [bacterium]